MSDEHANQEKTSKADHVGAFSAAFGLSYALTSVFSALLVVIKESSESVHHVLAVITGHHWVTHGLLDILLFVGLGLWLYSSRGDQHMAVDALIAIIVGSTLVSTLIIAGYFI